VNRERCWADILYSVVETHGRSGLSANEFIRASKTLARECGTQKIRTRKISYTVKKIPLPLNKISQHVEVTVGQNTAPTMRIDYRYQYNVKEEDLVRTTV
jgi:hypothetical protein